MSYSNSYPAKLLLFGEYSIIQGAAALALPLSNYSGRWRISDGEPNMEKQQGLWKLLKYLQQKNNLTYDIVALEKALLNGDYFDSSIPQGYGAGSSGAVCAAIYDRYALQKIVANTDAELLELKNQLANMESCFHGASSGVDPLICYLNQGVLFQNQERIQLISAEESGLDGFFLIDTGICRKTEPLVKLYKTLCKKEMYSLRLEAELMPLVEDAIDAFMKKESSILLNLIHQISHFQFKYFSEMIPAAFRKAWLDCLASEHSKLKLCGAGGGGFILGYSQNIMETKRLLSDYSLVFLT